MVIYSYIVICIIELPLISTATLSIPTFRVIAMAAF